jgi:hypothetical protein
MPPPVITVLWDHVAIRGYIDQIPVRVVDRRSDGIKIDHKVLRPRGTLYGWARCRVNHEARRVDLDYSPFADWNEDRGMDLGTLRLNFADTARKVLRNVEWRDAGAKVFDDANVTVTVPKGLTSTDALFEGAVRQMLASTYERDPRARARCIDHYGSSCCACGVDFGERYGEIAAGFIHVHHLRALSSARGRRRVDPVRDLRPVCPNCHAVLHLARDLTLRSLRKRLAL